MPITTEIQVPAAELRRGDVVLDEASQAVGTVDRVDLKRVNAHVHFTGAPNFRAYRFDLILSVERTEATEEEKAADRRADRRARVTEWLTRELADGLKLDAALREQVRTATESPRQIFDWGVLDRWLIDQAAYRIYGRWQRILNHREDGDIYAAAQDLIKQLTEELLDYGNPMSQSTSKTSTLIDDAERKAMLNILRRLRSVS